MFHYSHDLLSGMIEKELFVAILTQLGEMKISEKEAMLWTEILDRHKDGKLRINGRTRYRRVSFRVLLRAV